MFLILVNDVNRILKELLKNSTRYATLIIHIGPINSRDEFEELNYKHNKQRPITETLHANIEKVRAVHKNDPCCTYH